MNECGGLLVVRRADVKDSCFVRVRSKEILLIKDARLDHVALAVRDIGQTIPLYVDTLGARFLFGSENTRQGFRWAQFGFPGGGKIEFVTPTTPDGFVARFLERRGEGVHHITFKTDDIHVAIADVRARGITPVMLHLDDPAWKEAFVHPRDAFGVLVQVAQAAFGDEDLARHHLEGHAGRGHRHLRWEDLASGS